jgi:hypothetical protein
LKVERGFTTEDTEYTEKERKKERKKERWRRKAAATEKAQAEASAVRPHAVIVGAKGFDAPKEQRDSSLRGLRSE